MLACTFTSRHITPEGPTRRRRGQAGREGYVGMRMMRRLVVMMMMMMTMDIDSDDDDDNDTNSHAHSQSESVL
jgi:hypothetical protein